MLSRTRRTPNLRRRLTVVASCLVAFAVVASGTGMGAATSNRDVSTTLVGSLSMSEPVAAAANPICSRPVDTDACSAVSFLGGAERVLSLGSLSGTDVEAGSLTWRVTTTNPAGYTVRMSNVGAAPLLRGTAGAIADYPSAPVSADAAAGMTGFGVAMGSAGAPEPAVGYPSSPWVGAAGQGSMFAGIPGAGIKVAERNTATASDPFTATFAASSVPGSAPAAGSYSGTVSVVASAL